MRSAMRISTLCMVAASSALVILSAPNAASRPAQNVQAIEMTAQKYNYDPATVRVKQGSKVQLKITAQDRKHGFKMSAYPDGAETKGALGLLFTAAQDCWTLEQGTPTVIEFVAQTPGTYTFKCCHFCGTGHGKMKGELVVEP